MAPVVSRAAYNDLRCLFETGHRMKRKEPVYFLTANFAKMSSKKWRLNGYIESKKILGSKFTATIALYGWTGLCHREGT